ncbi:glutamate receptor ionotropic: NMDA 3A-like protein, partial [Dinothrombium tinctorium]
MKFNNEKCNTDNEEELSELHADVHKHSLWPSPVFNLLNLVPVNGGLHKEWKFIGNISRVNSSLNAIRFISGPTGDRTVGPRVPAKHHFRVVSGIAPPFVQHSTKLENGTCLTGNPCLKVNTSQPEELVAIFTDFNSEIRFFEGKTYIVMCCAGIAIDLLNAVSNDLDFSYDLYLVADGLFGVPRNNQWDGITADLVSGAAHLTFTAFSISSSRVKVIDYSVPFYYSGVSCLSYSRYSDVPLSAFLIPFSVQLWVAIFASLHAAAIAAAIYEWLSPFGLNPWGRQRTKNFSLASALWVMWSLLFSHLVAFKAPKSWPNKLMSMKTGVARSSASEGYIMKENMALWDHVQKYRVKDLVDGLDKLRNGTLEVLIGDTAILDYFRANDPGCNLKLLGDSIFDDAYAVGMQRGFPLKNAISELILEYNTYGFLDQLQRKWYGRVPCLEDSLNNLNKPKPLSVRAVAGVFIMLGCGLVVGITILILEHITFKYALPRLRKGPKEGFWKSPNLMFFSQKKAKEEARRRKSKSQFFEMIQEVRKVVQEQKDERRRDEPREIVATSFASMPHKQDSFMSETDSIGAATTIRTSSIRWKEPSMSIDEEPTFLHEPILKPLSVKPPSSLKSASTESRSKLIKSRGSTPNGSGECLTSYGYNLYKRSSSSIESDGKYSTSQTIKLQGNLSVSLEEIALPGDSGSGVGLIVRKNSSTNINTPRTWSFDDLSTLKKQLSIPSSPTENDKLSLIYSQSPRASVIIPSPRHTTVFDNLKLNTMSKEDIISLWRTSEREILNSLQDALQQKRALEEKVAILQRMLTKPP